MLGILWLLACAMALFFSVLALNVIGIVLSSAGLLLWWRSMQLARLRVSQQHADRSIDDTNV